MPGGPTTPRADFALYGSIVETPLGAYFFKMTGPGSTVAAQKGQLKAMLAKRRIKVGQTSIFRFLRHLKLTFKKKPARRRAGSTGRRGRSPSPAKEATKA